MRVEVVIFVSLYLTMVEILRGILRVCLLFVHVHLLVLLLLDIVVHFLLVFVKQGFDKSALLVGEMNYAKKVRVELVLV